jgi:hypothetical protein
MLAYLRSDTLLALAVPAVVGADAFAPADVAVVPLAVMLAYLRAGTLLICGLSD